MHLKNKLKRTFGAMTELALKWLVSALLYVSSVLQCCSKMAHFLAMHYI